MSDPSVGDKRKLGEKDVSHILCDRKEVISHIKFATTFNRIAKVHLFEANDELLEAIKENQDVKILGAAPESDAILCTRKNTFQIKKAETSNELLLVPPTEDPENDFTIENRNSFYYELSLADTSNKFNKLKEILRPTEYSGLSGEGKYFNDDVFMTFSDLQNIIQTSELELRKAMVEQGVVMIGEYTRLLSENTCREVSTDLIDTIIATGMSLDSVSEEQLRRDMPDADSEILKFILSRLGSRHEENAGNAGETWSLSTEKVQVEVVTQVFETAGKDKLWIEEDLMMAWSARFPGATTPDKSLLKGVALCEDCIMIDDTPMLVSSISSKQLLKSAKIIKCHRYFPVAKLSLDPPTRFKELFSARPRFTDPNDMEPYLSSLYGGIGQPKSLAELLMKYTRKDEDAYISK